MHVFISLVSIAAINIEKRELNLGELNLGNQYFFALNGTVSTLIKFGAGMCYSANFTAYSAVKYNYLLAARVLLVFLLRYFCL